MEETVVSLASQTSKEGELMTYHLEGSSFRIEGRSRAVGHEHEQSCAARYVDGGRQRYGVQQRC